MMPKLEEERSFAAIDLARFIFSLLIVAFHFPPFFGDSDVAGILDFIFLRYLERLAVPFFFLCSGFFLYRNCEFNASALKKEKKYILRMLRLYLVWTIVYLPLSINSFQYDDRGILHAVLLYIRNFIFTGSYFHLWYLNAAAMAVLLILIFRTRNKSPEKILMIAAAFYMLGLLAQSWFGMIKPMQVLTPMVWKCLKGVQRLIGTTRDGLFEAFLYTSIGMFFAVRKPSMKKEKAMIFLLLSLAALFVEIVYLKKMGWSRETDMYIFQVPAAAFLFAFVQNMLIKPKPVFKRLRKMSALIYYVHPFLGYMMAELLEKTGVSWNALPLLLFCLTIMTAIVFSAVILNLGERNKVRVIRLLY